MNWRRWHRGSVNESNTSMPDICMCQSHKCPLRNSCYRYRAIPDDYRQSYFMESPWKEKDGDWCRYHMEIYPGNERITPIKDEP